MSISLYNPYPDETLWRLFLPKESPLQYLTYGLMTESIINKVKKITDDPRYHFGYYYKRILIHCPQKRYEYIKKWVNRNITN